MAALLCVAGGIWALLVWAAGSFLSADIGAEGAAPAPPDHSGLQFLMLVYVAVSALAFCGAACSASPRCGRRLAPSAVALGYVPPLGVGILWDLVDGGRVGREPPVVALTVMWTLGGLLLAAAALHVEMRKSKPFPPQEVGAPESRVD